MAISNKALALQAASTAAKSVVFGTGVFTKSQSPEWTEQLEEVLRKLSIDELGKFETLFYQLRDVGRSGGTLA